MPNYLSDHGERNWEYRNQMARLNVLAEPFRNYLAKAKQRVSSFVEDPPKALYDAYANQIGVNLDRPISEYAEMARNPQVGQLDPNHPAIQEAMGWLPGPADNVAGMLGTIKDIPPPGWNKNITSIPVGHNPTPRELKRILKEGGNQDLRVLVDENTGDYYFWPADNALHQDIGNYFKLDPRRTEHGLVSSDDL